MKIDCSPFRTYQIALVGILVAGLVVIWNTSFRPWTERWLVLQTHDVPSVVAGYRKAPNLLVDGLRWWHGPWILEGIQVFRPVSSYLLWIETWVGFNAGFVWVAWFGVLLLIVDCCLTVALAWRLTRSRLCALLAAVLAPAVQQWNWGGLTPPYWLAWYPVHQDLLMIGFLMGAILTFDLWLETGGRRSLALTWFLFLIGALTKEFVYVLPLMAASLALGRPGLDSDRKRSALRMVGAMALGAAALYCYRTAVLPNPYNPPGTTAKHLLWNVVILLFPSFFKSINSQSYWLMGLAILIFGSIGGILWARWKPWGSWLRRPFAWLPVALVIGCAVWLYCEASYFSASHAFWFLFDWDSRFDRLNELGQMVFTLYALSLFWKYRGREPTAAALGLFVLAYAPVVTYLGWHYTLAGWFMRCAVYWPVVAKLVWLDVAAGRNPKEVLMSVVSSGGVKTPASPPVTEMSHPG